jgi:hypothetical protein
MFAGTGGAMQVQTRRAFTAARTDESEKGAGESCFACREHHFSSVLAWIIPHHVFHHLLPADLAQRCLCSFHDLLVPT